MARRSFRSCGSPAPSDGVSRFQSGLTLASVAPLLKKAFAIRSAPAVAIIVNSPGGSPVQSHLIYKRIRALAEEKEKTVIVFVEDVCASGGYMIACAGDEIVVDPASIVGSIGVVSAGFGFVEAMRKIGVERRIYTSGESKVILDPVPAGEAGGRGAASRDPGGSARPFHRDRQDAPRRGARERQGPGDLLRSVLVGKDRRSRSGLPTASATSARCCASAIGEKVRLRLFSTERSFFGRGRAWASVARSARALPERLLSELDERALWERYRL